MTGGTCAERFVGDELAVVDQHQIAARHADVGEVLGAVRFVRDAGNAQRERQRIVERPFDLGDRIAGQRIGQRSRAAYGVHLGQAHDVTMRRDRHRRLAGLRAQHFLEQQRIADQQIRDSCP